MQTKELIAKLRCHKHVTQGDGLSALMDTCEQAADALEAHEWRAKPLSSLPYDTPVIMVFESGNVEQGVWYDEPKEDYIRRFGVVVPVVGWIDLPAPPEAE